MRSKWIYMLALLCLLGTVVVLEVIDFETQAKRVHQHKVSEGPLPIIEINTNNQRIPGDPTNPTDILDIVVDFKSPQDGLISKARLRYRGNSSRWFDKKSMLVKLIDESGKENHKSLAGMAPHNEWVLNGPFLDRTLIRNYMAYNIAGEVMGYAPNVRFCELYVDKVYKGIYVIVENISRSKARIPLTKPEKNRDRTSYIVKLDRSGKGKQELDNFTRYTFDLADSAVDVVYPGIHLITPGRMQYIERDLSKVEKVLYSYDLLGEQFDYRDLIDVKAFAQYFVINEFFKNIDAGWYSTYYYKDLRGKLTPCVWDFNNSSDNYIEYKQEPYGFTMIYAPWFEQLIKDKQFVDEVIRQYNILRKGVLSEDYLLTYIDETIAYLGDAISRNYEVWGYVFDLERVDMRNYLMPKERNHTSYEAAVEQLKTYIIARGKWLDEHINTLYQYTTSSKNTSLQTP